MTYYNQYNYPHVPYPSPALPGATVKSGGCGVCCASMVLKAVSGIELPPEKMALYAMKVGARVTGGTDMHRLAAAMSRDFETEYKESSSLDELILTLADGGAAICNVSGDTAGQKGVFSSGGHYIVAAGIAPDSRIIIYDPGLYKGKYSLEHRLGKVEVQGNTLFAKASVLHRDCAAHKTRYYLFKGGANMTQERFDSMAQVWEEKTNPVYNTLDEVPEYWRDDTKALMACGAIKGDGKNPVATKRETLKAAIIAYRIFKGDKA